MKNRLLLITLLFLSLAPLSDASQKGIWPFRKKAKAAVEPIPNHAFLFRLADYLAERTK